MKKRAIKVALWGGGILLCGLLYGMLCLTTGFAIHCPFRRLTGLSCPGCGVSRMCIYLMQGKVSEAIRCNPALFFCMFPMLVVLAEVVVRYVKTGENVLRRWENLLLYVVIAILLIHGVVRNVVLF